MGFMRNNDRIEGIWKILGRGWASDPEKLADFEDQRALYDDMIRLELLRKGKIRSFREAIPQERKPTKSAYPQEDTFVRGD